MQFQLYIPFKKLLLTISVACYAVCGNTLFAQKVRSYSAGIHAGTIIPHSRDVQNTKGAFPKGIEISTGLSDTSSSTYAICKCMTESGINVQYITYNTELLGYSLGLNYYFEPRFALSSQTQLAVKGLCGSMYLSNPFHPIHNPSNMSYSTHVSFFLGIGTGIRQQFSEHWQGGFNLLFLHTSNAGIKDPNKGINWPVLQMQLQYYPQVFSFGRRTPETPAAFKHYGFTVYGLYSSKIVDIGDKVRHSVYGISSEGYKQISPINGLIAGAEIYDDHSLKKKLERQQLAHLSSIRSGITAGHYVALGRIQFSQQLGIYTYSQSPFFNLFYHRWGLNYSFGNKLVLGISLKAHRHIANFADVRLGYRWGK